MNKQPRDHRINPAALEGDLFGFDAAPTRPRRPAWGPSMVRVRP